MGQGCPVSALLCLFVAGMLACGLRHNSEIRGVGVSGMVGAVEAVRRADGVALALRSVSPLDVAVETVGEFCKRAGSGVDVGKTRCMLLGGLRDGCGGVGGVDVTSDAVGCLGICIGHSGNRCCELGWLHSFRSVERLFEFWRERGLAVGVVGVGSGLGALGAAWCGVLVGRACVVGRVGDGYLGVLGVDVGCVLNVSETGGSGFKIISKLPNIYKEVLSSFNDCKKH